MMNLILPKSKILTVFLFFIVFLFANTAFGQTTGDYRSNGTGSWTTLASWQYYNGSAWVTPSGTSPQGYPGQYTGTVAVTIRNTHVISISSNIPNSFTSLAIGNGASGKLIVNGTISVSTKSVTINSGGFMSFVGNSSIRFPANTSFVVNGSGKLVSESGSCSNNTALFIGSSKVSACSGKGGGALSDFDTFNARGGTGSATSNSPVCTGSTLTLTATPPTAASGSYTYTYRWSGNGIYTPAYSSSAVYPINSANINNHGGTYTVDILRNDGVLSTVSTDVVINPTSVGGNLDYATTPVCINSSVALHLSNSIGSVVRWEKKLSSSNSWTRISNTTVNYTDTPSQSGTWEYRVLVGSGSCTPVYSSSISVVVNPELFITLGANAQVTQLSTQTTLSYIANNGTEFDVVYTDPVAIAAGFTNLHGNVSGNSGNITLNIPYCIAAGVYNASIRVIKHLNATNICLSQYYPFTITVNSNPNGGTLSSNQVICSGNSPSNLSLTGNSGAVVKWQKSNDAAFTSPTDISSTATTLSGTTIGPLTQNTYFRVITNYNGCNKISSNSILITVGISAPTVGAITQPTCASVKGSFTITNYNASYTYTITPNSGVTQSGSTINAPEGSYTITASTLSCGTSTAANFSINAQPLAPSITAISTPSALCSGDSLSLTAPTVTANGSVLSSQGWEISTTSGGSTYTALTLPYLVALADAGKNIRYKATNGCGTTYSNVVALTVKSNSGVISLNGTPIPSLGTTYSPNSSAVFSIPAITGATYSWIVPTDWSIISGLGTNQIIVTTGSNPQGGSVIVTVNSLCSSSSLVTLSSVPLPGINSTSTPIKCSTFGSITFNNLPAGSWTLTVVKDGVISFYYDSVVTKTIGNLSAGTYTVTITDQYGGSASATLTIDAVTWKTVNSVTGWFIGSTPTAPTADDIAVFEANYSGSASIDACSCIVKNGASVKIDVGGVLNIVNGLIVETGGNLIFENNASLVQSNDFAINQGVITYNRTTPFLKDLDYEYWSSPVQSQTLGSLWGSDRYFRYTNGAWEAQGSDTTMDIGRGYIIRVRTAVPFRQGVVFKGVPINGVKKIKAQGANKSNLIGNPYPSAIDAESFMINNVGIIGGALYFWTHFTGRQLNNTGTAYKYATDDYATFNLTGAGSTAPSMDKAIGNGILNPADAVTPLGKIASGQAFFVVTDKAGDFTFDNSMRFDIDNGNVMDNSQFFRPSNTKRAAKIERNRVWLNFTNEGGAFKQLLVGYVTGASNDFDKLYDGVTRNGNAFVDFYSVNNSKNYTIQGRSVPFDKTDEVPLGYKTTIAGTFKIEIDKVDGGMTNQTIYLEDKLTNTIHNLKSGSYSFATEIGVFNDRFVLRYTNTSKLGTGDAEVKGKGVFVSVRNREIKINSFDQTMRSVKVYDLKGSLLYDKANIDKNEFIIDTLNAANQFMIVMVQLEDGKWISEEIIFHD